MVPEFNAVYYPEVVPTSPATLMHLALVFDKVYFPGVYIPYEGVDEAETIKQIERLSLIDKKNPETFYAIQCMRYAVSAKHLKDFCVFTGKFGYAGISEEGTDDLAKELEEFIYGPPPPGFEPMICGGFARQIPGNQESGVNAPGWITYPVNALLYSLRTGIPLVNDNPNLPVPGLPGAPAKSNATLLASVLAIESVKIVLPRLKAYAFEEVAEFREETREIVKPFRIEMLKLSKELNGAIQSESSMEDIQREAKFLAETTVAPALFDLCQIIEAPASPWHKRAIDLAVSVPEIVGNFATMPRSYAVARLMAKIASVLGDVATDQKTKQDAISRTGMNYLLRAGRRFSEP